MNQTSKGRLFWGVTLVIVGVFMGLNALGITDMDLFFDGWWTLFIIIPSISGIMTQGINFGSIFGLMLGIGLLLSAQGLIDFAMIWKLGLPAVIIAIGIKMIFMPSYDSVAGEKIKQIKGSGKVHSKETAAFTEQRLDYSGLVFEGANLDAVFASITCDLRDAIIEQDSLITASAVFAGIEIRVPEGVQVKIASNAMFGGVSDKRGRRANQMDPSAGGVTLYIEANSVFGGIDIT